jgi:hypothetical protein
MKSKIIPLFSVIVAFAASIQVDAFAHGMQHGFILSDGDTFGSHLVANGHHSRQVEIIGQLVIQDADELIFYQARKEKSTINQTYFLFQAQHLDLPNLVAGTVLTGHIVESKIGNYEPKNIIVKSATFHVQKVLLNILNPFFVEEPGYFRFDLESEKKHCCETVGKPCNWKC